MEEWKREDIDGYDEVNKMLDGLASKPEKFASH